MPLIVFSYGLQTTVLLTVLTIVRFRLYSIFKWPGKRLSFGIRGSHVGEFEDHCLVDGMPVIPFKSSTLVTRPENFLNHRWSVIMVSKHLHKPP
jgi:hypothetical protein